MPEFAKVTSDAGETVFTKLLDGYSRLTIPLFQRQYSWGKSQFDTFRADIDAVAYDGAESRFIGAVVAVERTFGPNFPLEYEIVDGQQRLVTIYLTIAAAAYVTAHRGDAQAAELAARLMRRYLFHSDLKTWNTKLSTSLDDAPEFVDLWRRILSLLPLVNALGDSLPKPPHATGDISSKARLVDQFERARRWLDSVWKDKGAKGVEACVAAATSNLSFVWLSLQDPASAPKIFESLNNRGVRTTVGDLIRNEIFARLRDMPEKARDLYDNQWKNFQDTLGDDFEAFFFPYGLIANRNVKKSELFAALRSRWTPSNGVPIAAEAIIADMQEYVIPFLAVTHGKPISGFSNELNEQIKRFSRLGLPAAIYPFVMQLIYATIKGTVLHEACGEIIHVVESFLVRRALCGHAPTGLHAAFKGLWHSIKATPTAQKTIEELRILKTVEWPSNAAVERAIAEKGLYGTSIDGYVVLEFEYSFGGADRPDNTPEIEHILPQKLNKEWGKSFTPDEHKKYVDLWANLVPLSSKMNKELSQGPYEEKRKRFAEDSMYKTPRELAGTFRAWTPLELDARTKALQQFAVKRWPF